MPVLQQGQERRPDVTFVFVNQGETAARVNAFLAREGLGIRNVLLDGASTASSQLGVRRLPTTLFIGRRGRLVASHVGELSYPPPLVDRLDAIVSPEASRQTPAPLLSSTR